MESRRKKASAKVSCEQQVVSKATKHIAGRGKKLQKSAQCYLAQIATLKANNTSLATALDEVKQECRKLHQDNLQLQQERQNLLERVASLENRLTQRCSKQLIREPALLLLQEAQAKLQEMQSALGFSGQKTAQTFPEQSPESKQTCTSKKVLRFSSPSQSEACTIYPRTPHPLHSMTCVVDGPQLASTPVGAELSSPTMNLSPQKIAYSDSDGDTDSPPSKEPAAQQCSPIEELRQWRDPISILNHKNANSTLDQLEEVLTCDRVALSLQRPRRKCASLSVSYQEPSLNRKLRRGDPFTGTMTDWNPPDHKDRSKKCVKKGTATDKRKTLQNLTNQQK